MEISEKNIITALKYCLDQGLCWDKCPYKCEGENCSRVLKDDVVRSLDRKNAEIISLKQGQAALDFEKHQKDEEKRGMFEGHEADEFVVKAKAEAANLNFWEE